VSRPALRPTQPPVQWVPGVLSPGVKRGRGVTLTTLPHLVPRSRMNRSYTPLPSSTFVACSETALALGISFNRHGMHPVAILCAVLNIESLPPEGHLLRLSLSYTATALGLVHYYSDVLPPATSWFNLWLPRPIDDHLLLYVPQPRSQGRYHHSRALSRRRHFGYSRHNGEFHPAPEVFSIIWTPKGKMMHSLIFKTWPLNRA
jgi:hypothetical protein